MIPNPPGLETIEMSQILASPVASLSSARWPIKSVSAQAPASSRGRRSWPGQLFFSALADKILDGQVSAGLGVAGDVGSGARARVTDFVAVTGWMRVHLMNDTANRNWFYGANCKACSDSKWTIQRKMMDP
jgi:hypothetical protein